MPDRRARVRTAEIFPYSPLYGNAALLEKIDDMSRLVLAEPDIDAKAVTFHQPMRNDAAMLTWFTLRTPAVRHCLSAATCAATTSWEGTAGQLP